jgi:hypothetical protein
MLVATGVASAAAKRRKASALWTPGLEGAPGGGKMEIADKLRLIAAGARRKRV